MQNFVEVKFRCYPFWYYDIYRALGHVVRLLLPPHVFESVCVTTMVCSLNSRSSVGKGTSYDLV